MTAAELQARAKRRYARIARKRRDPRYRRVLGRLVAAKVLTSTEDVPAHREPISVRDALWAGEVEPRILEVLPALLLKRPSLFETIDDLPDDLRAVIDALRRNRTPPLFRGIGGEVIERWVSRVGHRGKRVSQLKSFRMQAGDVELLTRLSRELNISQTAVIRRGLRALAAELLDEPGREAS